jgi:hypothetical protein
MVRPSASWAQDNGEMRRAFDYPVFLAGAVFRRKNYPFRRIQRGNLELTQKQSSSTGEMVLVNMLLDSKWLSMLAITDENDAG